MRSYLKINLICLALCAGCNFSSNSQIDCDDRNRQFPYYNDAHLSSHAQSIDNLRHKAPEILKLKDLKKVFVFPVTSRRYWVVGFANDFLSALESKGWKILGSDIDGATPLSHSLQLS